MGIGESFSMMTPPDLASLGDVSAYSFVGKVVVTGTSDSVLYLPFVKKKQSAQNFTVDFGDGEKWVVSGNLQSTVDDYLAEPVFDGVPYHQYQNPGTYLLTIDNGAEAITAGTAFERPDGIYLMWRRFGPLKEVYRCTLKCRWQDHHQKSAQMLGFGGIDLMWNSGDDALYGFGLDPPKKIYFTGITGSLTPAVSEGEPYGSLGDMSDILAGGVEEVYFPNATGWEVGDYLSHTKLFSNARNLRLVYMPGISYVCNANLLSKVPDRIDVFVGNVWSGINGNAFKCIPYGSHESTDEGGCCVHLHVNMTGAEFRAGEGGSWITGPTSSIHGERYLRVYATDEVFDTRGFWFDPETGHKQTQDGVWLDDNGRWIDRNGNYVLPDGVTPCVWHNNSYYKADSQGRRLSEDGTQFINWDGHIVNGCGRTATSDGELIAVTSVDQYGNITNGNIVDFYNETKIAKTAVPSGWYQEHPDIEYVGDYYYPFTEEYLGQMSQVWKFYDQYGYLLYTYHVAHDGRLVDALVPSYSYMLLGITFTSAMTVRIVGSTVGNDEEGRQATSWIPESSMTESTFADWGMITTTHPSYSGSSFFRLMPTYDSDDKASMSTSANGAYVPISFAPCYPHDPFDFDVTFGNLIITDNATSRTVSDQTQPDPDGGWGQLTVSHFGANMGDFRIKMIEIKTGQTVSHRLVPWVLNDRTVMKDLITGEYHSVTSGTWLRGAYYV